MQVEPVTESADLDMAFCRFGPCKAEVIRDQKTGDSLCFAFVEFMDRRHCEEAYFKMNNVLLDDRRIKVDFSQSVSKLWNKVKRRPWEKTSKRDGDAYSKERKSGGGSGRRELGGNLRLKSRGNDDFKLVEEEEVASGSRRRRSRSPAREKRKRSRSRSRSRTRARAREERRHSRDRKERGRSSPRDKDSSRSRRSVREAAVETANVAGVTEAEAVVGIVERGQGVEF